MTSSTQYPEDDNSNRFNAKEVESRWTKLWYEHNLYAAKDFATKPKKYILVEFPYPSGSGLHMGHVMRYTVPEIYSRKLRMSGFNVMFPIGWDAFGLPAENYAIKSGIHPSITTAQAIATFKDQITRLGYGVDWDREICSTDPSYYKWTQWLFIKFWEKGLAELREEPVWWCEALKTVLANEEVLDDAQGNKISERGNHPVEKRLLKQWVLKITKFAESLLEGLNHIDFPEAVKMAQTNWIGKSQGARINFKIADNQGSSLQVFTTRPDTILGVTYLAMAPEHPLVAKLLTKISNKAEVEAYCASAKNRSMVERQAQKDKTGVRLQGVSGIHPLIDSNKDIPLYVADYILPGYGTGAIMGVPAHDERDFEFATKLGISIVGTISEDGQAGGTLPYTSDNAFVIDCPELRSLTNKAGNEKISCAEMTELVLSKLSAMGTGSTETIYRLKDWLFSRQRYWGEPIPLVHRADGSVESVVPSSDSKAVAEKLPLLLPEVPDYSPSADGSSPLSKNLAWVNTVDSEGKPAKRETNTMPNWAGSCWYYMRFIDPKNTEAFADQEKLKYWLPVDRYFGGSEHTTLHLLYSRFWHQFLYQEGLVPTPEPYAARLNGGILLGADGSKQSKSKGNVVNPNEMLERYGADAIRLYVCFMGPYEATLPWNENGLKACKRLVDTIHTMSEKVVPGLAAKPEDALTRLYHKTVKRVSDMIDSLKMNTSVSEFMIFTNYASKSEQIPGEIWEGFLKLIAPFAVFVSEELWMKLKGHKEWKPELSIHLQEWPIYDPALAKDDKVRIGVQVNGKLRGDVEVSPEEAEDAVRELVTQMPNVQKWLEGKQIQKFVYRAGKIINIVVA